MESCRKSAELRTLGKRIIREKFPWIRDQRIRVGFCYSDAEKKKGKKLTYAECYKVQAIYKPWTPYDFVIVFYEAVTDLLTDQQREILMEHELMHIGIDEAGHLYIEQHDVEEFRPIIDKYGIDWAQID